jgi:hypothetical protein
MDPQQLQIVLNSVDSALRSAIQQIPALLNFLSNKKAAELLIADLKNQLDGVAKLSRLRAQHFQTLNHLSKCRDYRALIDKAREHFQTASLAITMPGRETSVSKEQITSIRDHVTRAESQLTGATKPSIIFADLPDVAATIDFIGRTRPGTTVAQDVLNIRIAVDQLRSDLVAIKQATSSSELVTAIQELDRSANFYNTLELIASFESALLESVQQGFFL